MDICRRAALYNDVNMILETSEMSGFSIGTDDPLT